jgi:hypothetical protein
MKRLLKCLLVFGLIVISAAVVIQWAISNKLRNENQLLGEELASLKSLEDTTIQREHQGGAGTSKAELDELLRLRSEVEKLRARMAEIDRLHSENQRLKQSFDSERDDVQARWKLRFSELSANYKQPTDYLGWIPEMNEALTNSDPWVRNEAAKVLRGIGINRLMSTNLTAQDLADRKSSEKAPVPGLLPALKDPDALVCANAAITLGFLHEDIQEVVPALMENLNSDQVRIAGSAAKALGRLQGDARGAVPALLQLTQSSIPNLRDDAINALKQIDPAAARSAGFE